MKAQIDVIISSDLDHEQLIAEILIDGRFVGLVSNEPSNGLCFEIPSDQISKQTVPLEALLKGLAKAERELTKK